MQVSHAPSFFTAAERCAYHFPPSCLPLEATLYIHFSYLPFLLELVSSTLDSYLFLPCNIQGVKIAAGTRTTTHLLL